MASVTFRIQYATRWGENLFLERRFPARTDGRLEWEQSPMYHDGGGYWSLRLDSVEPASVLEYRYEFRGPNGDTRREAATRRLVVEGESQVVNDWWLAAELPDGAFLRQAFAGVIFNPGRTAVPPVEPALRRRMRLTIRAPRVRAGQRLCVSGAHPLFGDWDPVRAQVMSGERYPLWELDLPADAVTQPIEFKFGLWDEQLGRLVHFEGGANRRLDGPGPTADVTVWNCEHFEYGTLWRGAGVAIPVFSLRTRHGYGIGEFADLGPFAEWASECHLHMVQLLPVNDTSSDFTWRDSYPYKAISTAALHPVYLNIERIYRDYGVPVPADYARRRAALNQLPQVDYEAVIRDKLQYLRDLFQLLDKDGWETKEFLDYMTKQADWLQPYAAFCRLRELHQTADFSRWGEYAAYSAAKIQAWFGTGAPEYTEVMFHCWVQFHADRQLKDALAIGHARGVAFKGDLPIGIDRASVEAWTQPELFRMDRQTGAPPDAFAVLGQNWGFPTYHWSRMEADDYAWWRRRFHRMAEAFDALRIDHILGFFRIWEIPQRYRAGIMGHYSPALPLRREEIRQAGFARDPARYCVGAASKEGLETIFGEAVSRIIGWFEQGDDHLFRLRSEFSKPEQRRAWYAVSGQEVDSTRVEEGITQLEYEVLFVEDPDMVEGYHPRINLANTLLYRSLPQHEQVALRGLHDDFYYRRHTIFWANEAMKKLPVLMDASPMLICGEDLGMVPDSVPLVLKRLGLLSLEVQRWPKKLGQTFAVPREYPYLSVCTASTHDMSTIRGWWEEEPEMRQRFFNEVMNRPGSAPAECTPEICRFIVTQHLEATSMWCVLSLQDWLGTDAGLRHPVAADERINIPAVPRHYWRYRMHLTVENLLHANQFNQAIRSMVEAGGRRHEG